MKFRIFLAAILMFFSFIVSAQEKKNTAPDYAKIKMLIQDENNSYYYPKLMARLIEFDTTLTYDEFKHLYYGYIYQESYDPYGMKSRLDEAASAKKSEKAVGLASYLKRKIMPEEYAAAIALAKDALNEFPFDDNALTVLLRTYELMGDTKNTEKVSFFYNLLVRTIMLSGNGASCDSGLHIIIVKHE